MIDIARQMLETEAMKIQTAGQNDPQYQNFRLQAELAKSSGIYPFDPQYQNNQRSQL